VLRVELGLRPGVETLSLLAQVEQGVAAQPMRLPRLVGRVAECARMQMAWQAGQAFVLLGEAGLGSLDGRPWRPAACCGDGRGPTRDEGCPAVLANVMRAVIACPRPGANPSRNWPASCPVGPPWTADDNVLADAAGQWLQGAAGGGLHGVLIDDLQHADTASLQMLRRWIGQPRPLLGFAARDSPTGAALAQWLGAVLTDSQRAVPLRLQPLDDSALAELVRSLDLPQADPVTLVGELARHWGGNPLFALEVLKAIGWGAERALAPARSVMLLDRRTAPSARAIARWRGGADFMPVPLKVLLISQPWAGLSAQILRAAVTAHESMLDAILRGSMALGHRCTAGLPSLARLGAPHERIARPRKRRRMAGRIQA
jgi:hypothetical protein